MRAVPRAASGPLALADGKILAVTRHPGSGRRARLEFALESDSEAEVLMFRFGPDKVDADNKT